MGTVITVQADSQAACAAELAWQCAKRGAEPVLPPTQVSVVGRWMARARVGAPDPGRD